MPAQKANPLPASFLIGQLSIPAQYRLDSLLVAVTMVALQGNVLVTPTLARPVNSPVDMNWRTCYENPKCKLYDY